MKRNWQHKLICWVIILATLYVPQSAGADMGPDETGMTCQFCGGGVQSWCFRTYVVFRCVDCTRGVKTVYGDIDEPHMARYHKLFYDEMNSDVDAGWLHYRCADCNQGFYRVVASSATPTPKPSNTSVPGVCSHPSNSTTSKELYRTYEPQSGDNQRHRVVVHSQVTCTKCGTVVKADEVNYQVALHNFGSGSTCLDCGYNKAGYYMSVDQGHINGLAAYVGGGQGATINVTSNVSWTAVPDDNWIHIDNWTGTGNGSFSVSVDANNGYARESVIRLVGTHGETIEIKVSQEGAIVNPETCEHDYGYDYADVSAGEWQKVDDNKHKRVTVLYKDVCTICGDVRYERRADVASTTETHTWGKTNWKAYKQRNEDEHYRTGKASCTAPGCTATKNMVETGEHDYVDGKCVCGKITEVPYVLSNWTGYEYSPAGAGGHYYMQFKYELYSDGQIERELLSNGLDGHIDERRDNSCDLCHAELEDGDLYNPYYGQESSAEQAVNLLGAPSFDVGIEHDGSLMFVQGFVGSLYYAFSSLEDVRDGRLMNGQSIVEDMAMYEVSAYLDELDKSFEGINAFLKAIPNAKKVTDIPGVDSDFMKLLKTAQNYNDYSQFTRWVDRDVGDEVGDGAALLNGINRYKNEHGDYDFMDLKDVFVMAQVLRGVDLANATFDTVTKALNTANKIELVKAYNTIITAELNNMADTCDSAALKKDVDKYLKSIDYDNLANVLSEYLDIDSTTDGVKFTLDTADAAYSIMKSGYLGNNVQNWAKKLVPEGSALSTIASGYNVATTIADAPGMIAGAFGYDPNEMVICSDKMDTIRDVYITEIEKLCDMRTISKTDYADFENQYRVCLKLVRSWQLNYKTVAMSCMNWIEKQDAENGRASDYTSEFQYEVEEIDAAVAKIDEILAGEISFETLVSLQDLLKE